MAHLGRLYDIYRTGRRCSLRVACMTALEGSPLAEWAASIGWAWPYSKSVCRLSPPERYALIKVCSPLDPGTFRSDQAQRVFRQKRRAGPRHAEQPKLNVPVRAFRQHGSVQCSHLVRTFRSEGLCIAARAPRLEDHLGAVDGSFSDAAQGSVNFCAPIGDIQHT